MLFFLFCLNLNISIFPSNQGKICFYVFVSKHCDYCDDIIDVYIKPQKENYPVEYKIFDLSKEKNFKFFLKASSKYNFSSNEIISILIGDTFIDEKQIKESLESIIVKYNKKGVSPNLSTEFSCNLSI